MALRWSLRPNTYYDSVQLMRVSDALSREPGVSKAAVVMATPLNVDLLRDDGLLPAEVRARPDDLVITVEAEDEDAAEAAIARLDDLVRMRPAAQQAVEAAPVRTLAEATERGANLAVIGVPGQYATAEAYAAMRAGMHVFLFSDNVPLQDEVRLKREAERLDLLMMGPDCGTAILNGVGLGFANRVQRGPVGIVGASGTGIQQVCCLLDAAGIGIAQAIGTGGRDLSAQVGGSMTRRAVRLLAADPAVEVIAVISKPGDHKVAGRIQRDLGRVKKPVVVCFLGEAGEDTGNVRYADTLTATAARVAEALGAALPSDTETRRAGTPQSRSGTVYGLFAGGTLCSEAGRVLDAMHVPHHLIDLGDDMYTRGRAHPIIDPRLRAGMIADVADAEDVAAVLVDVILGDLAHPDPAQSLLPAIEELRSRSRHAPEIVATLIGTRDDPQGLALQRSRLEDAGVAVFEGNADAAAYAGAVAGGRQ